MTSYWKPRWPHPVLFGSHRELRYRIDLIGAGERVFQVTTNAGPGFAVKIKRAAGPPGWRATGPLEAAAREWLSAPGCAQAVGLLLASHFSSLTAWPDAMIAVCDPAYDDIIPEGAQLDWCLEQLDCLWRCAPAELRRTRVESEFIG
jgi:hypothetical protein